MNTLISPISFLNEVPDCYEIICPITFAANLNRNIVNAARALNKWSFISLNDSPTYIDRLNKIFDSLNPPLQISPEISRFHKGDPREKVLFLTSNVEVEESMFLDPSALPLLKPIAKKFDLKYSVSRSLNAICQASKKASKAGTLGYIFIHAHSHETGMNLSN